LLLLAGRQTQAQLISDLTRYLRLHVEHIHRLAIVLLAPNVCLITRIHKFGADQKTVAALHDSAGQNRFDSKRIRHLL
jgi:hypothetical protein